MPSSTYIGQLAIADTPTRNGRIYTKSSIEHVISEFSMGGTEILVTKTAKSPIHNGRLEFDPDEVCGVVRKLYMKEGILMCEMAMSSHKESSLPAWHFDDCALSIQGYITDHRVVGSTDTILRFRLHSVGLIDVLDSTIENAVPLQNIVENDNCDEYVE